ncbi:MAG: enoyl-CoA hydratase/isomerase family protein [Pseudomonadota bacterium]
MNSVSKAVKNGVATLTLGRGKVNAINEGLTEELRSVLDELADASEIKAVVLTGSGTFFSFGLDVPEFLGYSKSDFIRFCTKFSDLYTYLFLHPKPVIASINGHAVGGGCIIATACDYRVMVTGQAKISLPEINFGSSLFPGSVDMLQYCVGSRKAELFSYTGAMLSAEEAENIGLADMVAGPLEQATGVAGKAAEFAARFGPAFSSIKKLLREDVADAMRRRDSLYRDELVDIWYSKETWEKLHGLKIY